MSKIIYVCSPLAARTHDMVRYSLDDNLNLAKRLCRAVATMHLVYDPVALTPEDVEGKTFIKLPKYVEGPFTKVIPHIPLASHVYFTAFLDDTVPKEHEIGMQAGLDAIKYADELWVYSKRGVSTGMKREIELASRLEQRHTDSRGIPVTFDPKCWEGL
jgi:hypothetical protein